nr:MAG TPA: hypothetical protein [Caudoviricetes sp.]
MRNALVCNALGCFECTEVGECKARMESIYCSERSTTVVLYSSEPNEVRCSVYLSEHRSDSEDAEQ